MPIKKTGQNKLEGRVNRKSDNEFSKELSQDTTKKFSELSGKKSNLSESPGNYEVYPGE